MSEHPNKRMLRKCPICGRMVVKRSNSKLYRHLRIDPVKGDPRCKRGNSLCEGTGRKVGR